MENFIKHCYRKMNVRRGDPSGLQSPTTDTVVVMDYFRLFYQNTTSVTICTETSQVRRFIILRKRLFEELGRLMLAKKYSES